MVFHHLLVILEPETLGVWALSTALHSGLGVSRCAMCSHGPTEVVYGLPWDMSRCQPLYRYNPDPAILQIPSDRPDG